MPSFARELEQTLHNALAEASGRRHEYATLEHLLLALIEDVHAGRVMEACGVNTAELRDSVRHYLDSELEALKVDAETDPSPTSGFQRVVQRAILHVQSSAATRSPAPTCSSPCSPNARATPSISCSSRT